ncbi:MAG: RDD family protein [Desulfuromonadales bacterium]|jgi:uncharacterized RDD family membrane protein YckC
MKCPKCGYHSFDYLESCKKCGGDLTEHKTRFKLRVPFFQGRKKLTDDAVQPADSPIPEEVSEASPAPTAPVDFGYDFMDDPAVGEENPAEASLNELLKKETDESFGTEAGDERSDIKGDLFFADEVANIPDLEIPDKEESDPSGEALDLPPGDEEAGFEFTETDLAEATPEIEEEGFDFPPEDLTAEEEPDFLSTQEEAPSTPETEEENWEEVFAEDDFEIPGETAGEDSSAEGDSPAQSGTGEVPPGSGPKKPALSVPVEEESEDLAGLFLESLDRTTTGESHLTESMFKFDDMAGDFESPREVSTDQEKSSPESPVSAPQPASVGEFAETPASPEEPQSHPIDPGEELDLEFPVFAEEHESSEATPQDPPTDSLIPPLTQKPSVGSRLGASAVDLAILCLTFWLFVIAGEAAFSPEKTFRLFPSPETLVSLSVPYFLVGFGLFFGYFTLFHFLVGQTPGKMLFGLRVEGRQGGESLLFSQAFLRSVGGLLSLIPAGAGFLAAALDRQGRGWNDRLAGSRVVKAYDEKEMAGVLEEGGLASRIQ